MDDNTKHRILSKYKSIPFFKILEKSDLTAVIDAMEKFSVEEGQVIFRQGDDGDKFYLIDKGKFNAFIEDEKCCAKLVATYVDEGYFGELALLHKQPRAATVKAETNGSLWSVSRPIFNKLIVRRTEPKPLTEYEEKVAGETASVNQRSSSDDQQQIQEIKQSKKQGKNFERELSVDTVKDWLPKCLCCCQNRLDDRSRKFMAMRCGHYVCNVCLRLFAHNVGPFPCFICKKYISWNDHVKMEF